MKKKKKKKKRIHNNKSPVSNMLYQNFSDSLASPAGRGIEN